jgi:uncharacterized protein (TIGR00369 family)
MPAMIRQLRLNDTPHTNWLLLGIFAGKPLPCAQNRYMEVQYEIFRSIIEEFIPFHKVIGFKLLEAREGFVSLLIPYRPELIGDSRRASIHGGVIATAMDAVGGAAAITTLKHENDKLSTIDLRVDYLSPGLAKDMITEGTIVKSGSKVIFTRMIAYHDNRDNLIAEGRGVYSVTRVKTAEGISL